MSANEYYGDSKQQYQRPSVPPPSQGVNYNDTRGYPPQQQQQYYQAPPQQQPQYYQQPQPQYYQHQPAPQQPIYVQQQAPQRGNEDCLTGCLAAMCLCCTLDMLF